MGCNVLGTMLGLPGVGLGSSGPIHSSGCSYWDSLGWVFFLVEFSWCVS